MASELKSPPSSEQTSFDAIPYSAPLTNIRLAPLMRVPPEPELLAWAKSKAKLGSNSEFLTVPPADLKGKRIIITGSNSGIGREAALQFAAWGANLVLGCRPNAPAHEVGPDVVVREVCKVPVSEFLLVCLSFYMVLWMWREFWDGVGIWAGDGLFVMGNY
jgi:hypothetical protein